MEFTLSFDQYEFTVKVTDYYVQKPMGEWADSDVDCYGYTDLEWEVLGAVEYDEDGNEKDVDVSCADDYSDVIDQAIMLEIEKLCEDRDYYD